MSRYHRLLVYHDITAPPLSATERAWLTRLNEVLQSCPTTRLACATIGDRGLTFYDADLERATPFDSDKDGDFLPEMHRRGWALAQVHSTFEIGSTAG